jgi:hypothetical protein
MWTASARQNSTPARHQPESDRVQPMLKSVLHSPASTAAQRRGAQDLAWQWVGSKWPRLLNAVVDRTAAQVHVVQTGAELQASNSDDGQSWSLAVAHRERDAGRTWLTRVDVSPWASTTGTVNRFSVLTACTPMEQPPRVLALPGVLQRWVDHLGLHDGGYAVLGEAREVADDEQLDAFMGHVLSPLRTLPILALCHQPRSLYYGVDPQALATAVRGMAHVACMTTSTSAAIAQRWGSQVAPVAGAARLYKPGFSAAAAATAAQAATPPGPGGPDRQPCPWAPLWRDTRPAGLARNAEPGAFRRELCQKVCALSLS